MEEGVFYRNVGVNRCWYFDFVMTLEYTIGLILGFVVTVLFKIFFRTERPKFKITRLSKTGNTNHLIYEKAIDQRTKIS